MTLVRSSSVVSGPVSGPRAPVVIEKGATPNLSASFQYGGNMIRNPEAREGTYGWQPFEILSGSALATQTVSAGRVPQRRPYRLAHVMLGGNNSSIIQAQAWTCPEPVGSGVNRLVTQGGFLFAEHHMDTGWSSETMTVALACAKNPSGSESPYSAHNGTTVIRTVLTSAVTFTVEADHPRYGSGLTAISTVQFFLPATCAELPWMALICYTAGGAAAARTLYQGTAIVRPETLSP